MQGSHGSLDRPRMSAHAWAESAPEKTHTPYQSLVAVSRRWCFVSLACLNLGQRTKEPCLLHPQGEQSDSLVPVNNPKNCNKGPGALHKPIKCTLHCGTTRHLHNTFLLQEHESHPRNVGDFCRRRHESHLCVGNTISRGGNARDRCRKTGAFGPGFKAGRPCKLPLLVEPSARKVKTNAGLASARFPPKKPSAGRAIHQVLEEGRMLFRTRTEALQGPSAVLMQELRNIASQIRDRFLGMR